MSALWINPSTGLSNLQIRSKRDLAAKLMEGAKSGRATAMTDKDWTKLKTEVREQIAARYLLPYSPEDRSIARSRRPSWPILTITVATNTTHNPSAQSVNEGPILASPVATKAMKKKKLMAHGIRFRRAMEGSYPRKNRL